MKCTAQPAPRVPGARQGSLGWVAWAGWPGLGHRGSSIRLHSETRPCTGQGAIRAGPAGPELSKGLQESRKAPAALGRTFQAGGSQRAQQQEGLKQLYSSEEEQGAGTREDRAFPLTTRSTCAQGAPLLQAGSTLCYSGETGPSLFPSPLLSSLPSPSLLPACLPRPLPRSAALTS